MSAEAPVDLSLYAEIIEGIKRDGNYSCELAKPGVIFVMNEIVASQALDSPDVVGTMEEMDPVIRNGFATVNSTIDIESPVNASVVIDWALRNGDTCGKLKQVYLNVEERAGVFTRLTLSMFNIKGRIQEALCDPNAALVKAFNKKLQPCGVQLTSVELTLLKDTLSVVFYGECV